MDACGRNARRADVAEVAIDPRRRHAPDGKEHAANTYVFGNEVGEHVAYGSYLDI
jgi:hypothetical protein